MFEGGVDRDGQDIRGPLGRLESPRRCRIENVSRKQSKPGATGGFARTPIPLHKQPRRNYSGYDVELQGEFNAVRVHAAPDEAKQFFSGQRTTFV